MSESIQHLLEKIRPPRVQITYDVEIGDAIIMKQLPFTVGVLADLAGVPDPNSPPAPLKDRQFDSIDRTTFDVVMSKIGPRLPLQVQNVMTPNGGPLEVLLNFKSMQDFNPLNVARQVPEVAQVLQARELLANLLTKLVGNQPLETLLESVLTNPDLPKSLLAQAQAAIQKSQQAPAKADAKPGQTPPAPSSK